MSGKSDIASGKGRPRAALFDLDGVLVDSRNAITTCLNHALEAVGEAPRPTEELEPLIGPALADAFAELLGLPRESERVAGAVAAYRAVYGEISLTETTVVPGIPEVLDDLATDHLLAVATSKPRAFAVPILEALDLRRYFDTVAGPDLNPLGEPKATTIATALAALTAQTLAPGDHRGNAFMVGDRRHDVEGARANGIPCIGVLWGIGSREELQRAGADELVEHPAELRKVARRPPSR